jgi:Dullard-like phosphatase family protein
VTNNVDKPDKVENYFLSLLDYEQNEPNELFINDDNPNNKDNPQNNKEKEILQKEFIDQFECFKMMFCFLTQKDLKINKENETENKIIENNNNSNIKNDKKNISDNNFCPYKNCTFTSNYKSSDPLWNENTQNTSSCKTKVDSIKNNLTNSAKDNIVNNNNIINSIKIPHNYSDVDSSFYLKLKYYFNLYYNNLLELLEKNKVKPPFLPELDTKKYKYTLVLDLDETLVHYIEEENSAYVQVRPYADFFLKELSKFFEIVLFTAAEEDYTDIVLKELNKNNYITHVLCRKYTELNNGSYIKDLSKLGRDLKRVCIVDNNKDNFSLQPENGLFISSYYGEQNDNELNILCQDLMKIIELQPDDIRPVIKEIDAIMKKRYSENNYD